MGFWSTDSEQEAADGLRDFVVRFAPVQRERRQLAERYAQCTEGMRLTCLGPWGYSYDSTTPTFEDLEVPIIRNVAHEVVDTLTSKIGAIDPPLPAMLTNKGSWKDRRQASDLELLVRAEYTTPKGIHATLHDVWIAALKLAAGATGNAAVHYYNDAGKVGARIHDTLDMAWSPDMRTQACWTWLPIDDVIEMYPEAETEIRECAGDAPDHYQAPTRNGEKLTDFVCLFEGWRGASAKKPGKYVCCLKSGAALAVEEYPHQRPPFVWLGVDPHMYGPLAHSMVHHIYESMKRDNLILMRIDRAINKTNERTTYVETGALVKPEALSQTTDHMVVELNPGAAPPVDVSPAGFSVDHLTVADRHYDDAHNVSGMAQSHTAGTRQEGVDSAIGQRYVAALVNERFAALQRRYVQAVAVDSAEVIIQILCDIFDEDPKIMRLAPGQDTLREVSGALALKGLDALKYVVQAAAVSGNKGSPADRMQTAHEMNQRGALDNAGLAAMQDNGFDLPELLDDQDIQRQWIDKQVYRWQFASDDEVAKPDFYVPPFEHFRHGEALIQLVDAYTEAQMDELEPERLDFFFMAIADVAALAAAQAPPPQAPAPPPMPVPIAA